jgi:hypothetical protein
MPLFVAVPLSPSAEDALEPDVRLTPEFRPYVSFFVTTLTKPPPRT